MKLHEGSLKLAGLYLTVLMTISLFFSGTLYKTSMTELDRGLRRPGTILTIGHGDPNFPDSIRHQIIDEREDQYDEAHDRIVKQLVTINLLILVGGGVLCYYLALRTLKPIEEAHAAQNQFTADASHELRTPITTMRTENEVALMNPALTLHDAKTQLQSNVEELEKLTDLSEGLLRLARIENNHLVKKAHALQPIVDTAVTRVLSQAEKRNIIITPLIETEKKVYGDEVSLTEALIILIDNAVKYSPDKSEVTVRVRAEQKQIIFDVIDQGIGINASEQPFIFQRFYRADSSRTKQNVGGYGLGLAIAHDIAEAHNGSLTVTSKPKKGSTFTFSVPSVE